MSNPNGKIKALSLFSGIGGFEEGLFNALGERASVIAFSEIDNPATATFQSNPNPMKFKKGDILVHKLGKQYIVIDTYQTQDGDRYDIRDDSLSVYSGLEENEFKLKTK